MTMLIMVYAAVISTVLWYVKPNSNMRIGTLAFMYWGAALMWFVDAVSEYIKTGMRYFFPETTKMINDAYLGLSAVALGLIIWLVIILVKDPNKRLRKALSDNKQ